MALTTYYDIINCCANNGIPLVGVFSKDQLPRQLQLGGYVVNLQDSHDASGNPLPGTHWVSIWIDRTKKGHTQAAFFDPMGCVPPVAVQKFLKPLRPYPYCSFQIQSLASGVCGYYAVEFLWTMHTESLRYPDLDKRFDAFLEDYSYNPSKNRMILVRELKDMK